MAGTYVWLRNKIDFSGESIVVFMFIHKMNNSVLKICVEINIIVYGVVKVYWE